MSAPRVESAGAEAAAVAARRSALAPPAARSAATPACSLGFVVVCVYLALTEPVFLHWDNWQNIIRIAVRRAHARDRDDVRRPHRRHRPLDRLGDRAASAMILGIVVQHGGSWWLGCLAVHRLRARCSGSSNGLGDRHPQDPVLRRHARDALDLPEHRAAHDERRDDLALPLPALQRDPRRSINGTVGPFPTVLLIGGGAVPDRRVRPALHGVRPRRSTRSARTPRPRG